MAPDDNAISELISLHPQFLRSVHLERDFYAKDAADGYLVTRSSRSALSLLSRGVVDPSYRAQSISGPYGAGKSALAMYFARLLDRDRASNDGFRMKQRAHLGEIGTGLIPHDNQGYLSILISGTREGLAECLLNGVRRSLKVSGRRDLATRIFNEDVCDARDARRIVQAFEELAKAAVEEGALGIIVIIDELGKILEHAALAPEDSDIHVLQEMAEAASRSLEYAFWFVTILQQDFSYYASRLGKRYQREWSKVQQRFFDVPCLLDDTDALHLVASALDSSMIPQIRSNAGILKAAEICAKLAPKGAEANFENWCVSSYPVHPTALLLMPALFRRHGQNERSLFSFLSANEAFSLREWAREHAFTEDDPAFLRIPQLLDYASHTLLGTRPNPYSVRAWTEMEDALSRLGEASPLETDVLKTVGLLGLLGDAAPFAASHDMLRLSLESRACSHMQIDQAIKSLETKRLIVFRRFRNAHRLWEGSDIDISECLSEAYESLPLQSVSLSVARDLCTTAPIVARRHSFHTGMLRFFAILPSSKKGFQPQNMIKGDFDGCIVQCLVSSEEEARSIASYAQGLQDPSMITIVAKETDELAESARDVAALEWVKKNTPSLAADRVARQELSERQLEAEISFRTEWQRLFEPGHVSFTCYWNGKEWAGLTKRAFTSLLSDACDATFPYSPRVKNELINRRVLSSAAAAARRKLMEAMISHPETAGLGFTGYPPERSIYESVLVQSGIHRETADGLWFFGKPEGSDPGLIRAWDYMTESLGCAELRPKSIADLFRELSGPPYGLALGVLPVLLCAFLLSRSSTVAIYEDDVFLPDLSIAVMDRLVRRPDRFSAVAFHIDGERAAMVSRFAKGFGVADGVLPVIRSLYRRIHSLPYYTIISDDLPPAAIGVREAILRAKSPERLLFVELPKALSQRPFNPGTKGSLDAEKIDRFFRSLNQVFSELLNCYPRLLTRIEEGVLRICDVPIAGGDWRTSIPARLSIIRESVVDPKLRAVLLRVQDCQLDREQYLESIGAVVTDKTPDRWSKSDEAHFARLVPELASKMRAVESTHSLNSVLGQDEDGYLLTVRSRNGDSVRQVVRFVPSEQQVILRMADMLDGQIDPATDRRVVLAALIESARRIIRSQAEDGE